MTLQCALRNTPVPATPEEHVRQQFLQFMLQTLHYPASVLAVEKSLDQLPHLQQQTALPNRRADLICFEKDQQEGLSPLLLVEFKAVKKVTDEMMRQLLGYNYFVKAKFVTLVNYDQIQTGFYDPRTEQYQFINYLPTYLQLISLPSNSFAA